MSRRSYVAARSGRGRWVLAGGLLGLVAMGYLAYTQAAVFVQRALDVAFANADTEAHGVWFDWNGDIVARDIVLYLGGPTLAGDPAANTLRFERMRLRTPDGWMFFVRHLVDRRLEHADVDALRMTLTGFETSTGVEPTLGTLGPIGAMSASPFETEGCLRHAFFVRDELTGMGLDAGATTLDVDLRESGTRIATRIVLDTPGASRVQYDREESIAKSTSLLKLGQLSTATQSEHWDISDQGFVRARNAFCAKQDGVDVPTFVARHMASVQRLLETRGLVADPQSLAAYADFAEKGGQLAFGGPYAPPLHSSERAAMRRNGSALLRMQGKLEHGSMRNVVQWRGTKPRPLDTQGGATFAAMTKENGGVPPALKAWTPPEVAATTPPVAISAAVSPPTGSRRPQYASSLPTPALVQPGGRLAWDDLPRYQGRMVQVFTMRAEPRTAILVSANDREIRVRARMQGGHADYRISRDSFVRALLIH